MRSSQPKFTFPPSLNLQFVGSPVVSLIEKEKSLIKEWDTIQERIRATLRERDEELQVARSNMPVIDVTPTDNFDEILEKKRAIRNRMDELQLVQAGITGARNESQLIAYDFKPLEDEIASLEGQVVANRQNEEKMIQSRAETLKESPFQSTSEVEAEIARIEKLIDAARQANQTGVLNGLSKQKAAADRMKRLILETYQVDERIVKENKRLEAINELLVKKRAELSSLHEKRDSLRSKANSSGSLNDEFRKLKKDLADLNGQLDDISAARKNKSKDGGASSDLGKIRNKFAKEQAKQFEERDRIVKGFEEVAELAKDCIREVKYNTEYRRHLIGRGGATLDTLMRDFGVSAFIDGDAKKNGTIMLFGDKAATEACAQAVNQIIDAAIAADKKETIDFNPKLTKTLIGQRGATIDRIQTVSGAQIKVDGDKVHISGTDESISAAKVLIQELVAANASDHISFEIGMADVIIGRGGATIRQVEKDSGVKGIHVDKNNGIIEFSGREDAVAKAKEIYNDIIEKSKYKLVFSIPTRMVAAVIGPQGSTIRELQDATQTSINTQSKGANTNITVRGSAQGTKEAKRLIEDIALREEEKIPFDPVLYNYLTTRPMDEAAELERLSPLEAIREQCECDQVSALRVEGKIVIRGRREALAQAKRLLAQVLESNAVKVVKVPVHPVLITFFTQRRKDGSPLIEEFRKKHSAKVSGVEIDRVAKSVAVVGNAQVSQSEVLAVSKELEELIQSQSIISFPIQPFQSPAIIGTGGKTISELQTSTKTVINVDRDTSTVSIFSPEGDADAVEEAKKKIMALIEN